LNADLNKILGGPLKAKLEAQGIAVGPSTSEHFAAHVKAEIEKWTKVVKAAKLEAE
jgi:tripartite-type tricarboxylate transporter receptor subunit TctC